jgi:Holliday junction resolvase RusA-like endonuclease
MIITIPTYKPPSLNEFLGKHWSVGYKLKNDCKWLVMYYSKDLEKATDKRRVDMHIVLGKGARKLDADNAWKIILDSLRHAGMLVDDSPEYCVTTEPTYSRGEPQTIITLTDV